MRSFVKKLFRLPIYTETSPNMQWDDIFLVLRILFSPWTWKNKKYSERFAEAIRNYSGIKHILLNDSGRTSLYLTLKSLDIGEGDEVILPSFTCLVVANAVRWSGATPVYLDTNRNDFNASYDDLNAKITEKTKAILVQHTFGKMVDIDKIRSSLKTQNSKPIIIEDWAHTLRRDQILKGDVGFLTFGIEKMFSTIRGGAIITNDDEIAQKCGMVISNLQEFPIKRTIIGLLNPLFWWVDVPLHKIGYKRYTLGAAVRVLWRKLGFLGIMIEKSENKSIKPDWYPAKLSPALARLGINQLKKIDRYNNHRTKIAKLYHESLGFLSDEVTFNENRVYVRYPVLLRDEQEKSDVWETAKALKITLGAWFKSPLYATYVTKEAFDKLCFVPANTPETVRKCATVLNLPTSVNISEKRAIELTRALERVLHQ